MRHKSVKTIRYAKKQVDPHVTILPVPDDITKRYVEERGAKLARGARRSATKHGDRPWNYAKHATVADWERAKARERKWANGQCATLGCRRTAESVDGYCVGHTTHKPESLMDKVGSLVEGRCNFVYQEKGGIRAWKRCAMKMPHERCPMHHHRPFVGEVPSDA